jgi:3-deoxy-manno-octulosonate cytidylyltransferase (CMP-KDO synthetase)
VLADIAGKPMVEHVYRRASQAPGVDAVVVATDDERIANAVETFGGVARLTRPGHRTGTDRVAETARDLRCEIVVNVQADLPLIEPEMIAEVIAPLVADAGVQMSTLRQAISDTTDQDNPNVVKVVVDRNGDALYFSRAKIPYCREDGVCFKHIGLYAFRRDFLLSFAALSPTPLERAESLEQLRALEHGIRIKAVETAYDSIGVDTPEDLEQVRRLFATTTSS